MQALQSLSRLQVLAGVQEQFSEDLPSVGNSSDQLQDLELFMCGENRTESTGLADVFQRLTQGDSYQQGGVGRVRRERCEV